MGPQVSYNVQTAVDTKYKLIVAHEVTNAAVDRNQLFAIAGPAQHTLQREEIKVLADRGYYKGEAIKDCYDADIHVQPVRDYSDDLRLLRKARRCRSISRRYRCAGIAN